MAATGPGLKIGISLLGSLAKCVVRDGLTKQKLVETNKLGFLFVSSKASIHRLETYIGG